MNRRTFLCAAAAVTAPSTVLAARPTWCGVDLAAGPDATAYAVMGFRKLDAAIVWTTVQPVTDFPPFPRKPLALGKA
jgi:hypothetical protein